ncbi:MAG: serine hydrolase [Bacteroidales bacterium]|nr:serine hydrolase [Bacteroidales bacterium]
MTVRDLITMSAGQEPDPTFTTVTRDSNWVKSFLATPVKYKPGTKFLYNSLATYMLSAIVQKVTGEKVIDYLKPRLFDPLKIEGMDWEVDPQGRNVGGWGLRLKTEDMAKFGQLLLQKGKWDGMPILPSEWIDEATSFKIDQAPDAAKAVKESSDWMQGYCYQFWRCRHNAFRADGAYGQYIIVLPEQNAVIAITSESPDMQAQLNLVWEHLLPAFKKEELPASPRSESVLREKLESLSLPEYPKSNVYPIIKYIEAKKYAFSNESVNFDTISFSFGNNLCELTLMNDTSVYKHKFASGKWNTEETDRPGPSLLSGAIAANAGLPPFKTAGNYQWVDSSTLELKLRYIESPHAEIMLCKFSGDSLQMEIMRSLDFGQRKTDLTGKMIK